MRPTHRHHTITTMAVTRRQCCCCCFRVYLALSLLLFTSVTTAFAPRRTISSYASTGGRDRGSSSSSTSLQNNKNILNNNKIINNNNNNNNNNHEVPPLRRTPPRKICLMIEPTPFTHVSGYANRFQELLKFLRKANDNVDILTVDSKTPASQLPTDFQGYPIQHTMGFTFPLYQHISLTFDLPEMKGARMIETNRPDLIHVTSPGFLLFASIFYARVLCVPLVMSYHTHLPLYGRNYLGFVPKVEQLCWELLRWAHSRADLTLCTSPQMQEELQQNGIPRVEVWRKGIDTERFHPQYKTTEMRKIMTNDHVDDFLMVYVGRLGAEKRLKDIRDMLEKLPSNTRLCIVGKGPQEEELQKYFANTNTVFTGQLSGNDLSAAFASADVFVMPSDSETLGFVVLESMASGVPVVGANAGGIPDIIDHGKTGFLVDPGNLDKYVQHLNELRDARFRGKMGAAARKEAERWGWEAATSYLRNVQYEKALINFHSRAFGGFGRPGTAGMWRLLGWRIGSFFKKFGIGTSTVLSTMWRKVWRNPLRRRRRRKQHQSLTLP